MGEDFSNYLITGLCWVLYFIFACYFADNSNFIMMIVCGIICVVSFVAWMHYLSK